MKEYLESLKNKFETADFIKDDPVQFPHLFFGNDIKNVELAGLISSIFAFGKREVFISKLNLLFDIMRHNPYEFILNIEKNEEKLNGFIYRFYKDSDIKALMFVLSDFLKKGMSIGDIFYKNKNPNLKIMLERVYDDIKSCKYCPSSKGFSFMISNPRLNGANKRMNMFLRWMVRKGPVDLGLWDFIEPCNLIIPLDVHCGNVARKLKLLERKQNDCKSAFLLTEKLKEFDPKDPVKYDFALFGAGVYEKNSYKIFINKLQNSGVLL